MSSEAISALERGLRRTPQRETLSLLLEALDLTADERAIFEAVAHPSSSRRAGGGSITVGPWPTTEAFTLPVALTAFIGRAAECSEISALLAEHRLVTITGPGGIGKTQTALRVGSALSEAGELPVCFVPLSAAGESVSVVAAIGSALSIQDALHSPPIEPLIGYLKDKPRVLLLDGCEHLIDDVARAAHGLLGGSRYLRILATSRCEPPASTRTGCLRCPIPTPLRSSPNAQLPSIIGSL